MAHNRETLGPCGYYFANALELTEAIDRADEENTELARLERLQGRARVNYRYPYIICKYLALLEQALRSRSASVVAAWWGCGETELRGMHRPNP